MGITVRVLDTNGGGGVSFATLMTVSYAVNGNVDPTIFDISRGQGNPSSSDFINWDIANNNAMRIARSGGIGGVVSDSRIIPITLMNSSVMGLAQFAQATLLNVLPLSANTETGPAVFLEGDMALDQGVTNGGNGYAMLATASTGNWMLRRASITETSLLNTGVAYVQNDVARIEVTIIAGGTRRVTLKVNGAQIGQVDDGNAALRPTAGAGFPGMFAANVPVAGTPVSWGVQSFGIL